jgi:flavin reductase (DIM6/NTAB) family NADH-FMN oxidoreductase RutF
VSVSAEEFKEGLSHWASGVTIVTAAWGGKVHGMTVSAFSSVSLDPPLVLVCADKASNTLPLIEAGACFAVSILAEDQLELSNRFASKKDEWRRFEGLECERGPTGAPFIPGALATLDCRVRSAHEAGDHVIYVGEVEHILIRDKAPLLYFHHRYHGMGERRP